MTGSTAERERTDVRARDRLVQGMLLSIEERGYAATTVLDIVRHARVSKRTFYEHFSSKDDALRALYALAVGNLNTWFADAGRRPKTWEERLRRAVLAFVEGLAAYPGLARTILVELAATGPLSLAARDAAHQAFVDAIRQGVDRLRVAHPELRPLSEDMAVAFVGAIHELMVRELAKPSIDADHVADVGEELLTLMIGPRVSRS
ncbi:TetR/AcrR family transcriptional regulator [Nocardioides humilatus]|nr:TetR/AcrR family transcriptional regulator [Nocardioides humilatus]